MTQEQDARIHELEQQLRRARRGFVAKSQVKAAMKEGKRKYGMCREMNKLADKYSLVGPDMVDVEVDLGVYGKVQLQVDADVFDELSEEDRLVYLKDNVSFELSTVVNGQKAQAVKVNPPVESYTEVLVEVPLDAHRTKLEINPPVGYVAMYLNTEGRVLHFISSGYANSTYIRPLCGTTEGYVPGLRSETSRARETEDGALKVCNRCAERTGENANPNYDHADPEGGDDDE